MKNLFLSMATVAIVGAIGFAATNAFFTDTETSTGNTFTAGAIDLKIDHTKQTYNDYDCNTCSVILISDATNMVVEKDGVLLSPPTPAVLVGYNSPYFIHPAWTAEEDPILAAAGAEWIWATDPTTQEDVENGVIYTFQKTFEWYGPIIGSDMWFAVGSDNSVEVWLNGTKIAENLGEFGYKEESMLHILGTDITDHVIQGNNVLEFKINNFPRPDYTPFTNPGGFVYKFEINGLCTGNYFKENCKLWALKDLTAGDLLWNLNDVKPADHGTNVISYHVFDNDAYMCAFFSKEDQENTIIEPEAAAGDTTEEQGELSKHLEIFVWDDNSNGIYEPGSGETGLFNGTLENLTFFPIAEPTGSPVAASITKYLGLAWCFGDLTVDGSGAFTCDGSADLNEAQTDILNETVRFYAEQARNNPEFSCAAKIIPTPTPTPTVSPD